MGTSGQIPGGRAIEMVLAMCEAEIDVCLTFIDVECGATSRTAVALSHLSGLVTALSLMDERGAVDRVHKFIETVKPQYKGQKVWDLTDPQPQATDRKA